MELLFITIATVTLLIIAGIAFYGGFRRIKFHQELVGGELLIYKKHVGDYKYSATLMDHIYHTLEHEFNIITHKGCGIYYDNPKTTDKHKLRADIGCVLEEKDHDKLPRIKELFEVKEIPRLKNITTSFPYHGKFSVFMSIIRVYPALDTYLKKNNLPENGPVVEIYDIPNKVILFRKELTEENK
jgi:hypothetical protein